MSDHLPPRFGKPATKVMIDGTTPGSPESRLVYQQLSGTITRFHQSARRAAETMATGVQFMQRDLPGLGRMSYNLMGDFEVLRVTLRPAALVKLLDKKSEVEKPKKPALAVDVIFYPHSYIYWDHWFRTVYNGYHSKGHHQTITRWSSLNVAGLAKTRGDGSVQVINSGPSYGGLPPDRDFFYAGAGYTSDYIVVDSGDMPTVPYVDGGEAPGMQVAGFLVKPEAAGVPVAFDVFAASLNTIETTVGAPNPIVIPDWQYDYTANLNMTFQIRVREFSDDLALVAVAAPTWNGEVRQYQTWEDTGAVEEDFTSVTGFDAGALVAYKGYAHPAGQPLSTVPRIGGGTTLAETAKATRTVAGPEDSTKSYYALEWTGTTGSMSRIGRVSWTPPSKPGARGSASISLA